MRINAYWLPPDCPVAPAIQEEEVDFRGKRVTLATPQPTPAEVQAVANYLKERQHQVLRKRSIHSIIDALDAVAALWLNPDYILRKQACAEIAIISGFSQAMVAHAIELEQLSSRKSDMLDALTRELGSPDALDGFAPTPKGFSMAVGPQLIGGIFSSNIPALPHLTVMRSLLVKSACLGRVSRSEPVYLPLYLRSLATVDADLASCMAVLHWEHNNHAVENAFLESVDHLIAYGGDASLKDIKSRCPDSLSATWHGHRMGFAYIPKSALTGDITELADKIAYDFSVFDQHACLAPQACFVEEGGTHSPRNFAEHLATSMSNWLEKLPPRQLDNNEAARLRQHHDSIWVGQSLGVRQVELLTPTSQIQGSVVLESQNQFEPCPLDRFARVVPINGPQQLIDLLHPMSRYLQCAALAGPVEPQIAKALALLGVTRICPPGQMGTPSMVWAHDGRACLNELVRWCDHETIPPGEPT